MTAMRPDPNSDEAGLESEYGDDTGFAAEATRTSDPNSGPVEGTAPDDSAGLTAEDDAEDPGNGAD